jgi:hypothetical protein
MPRKDTKLESGGAEFLVLDQLLIRGIGASKGYTNQRNYDLIAFSYKTKRIATIQVKSRWAADARHFSIKKGDYDFIVFVKLNRGQDEQRIPEYYVIPAAKIRTLMRDGSSLKGVGKSELGAGLAAAAGGSRLA